MKNFFRLAFNVAMIIPLASFVAGCVGFHPVDNVKKQYQQATEIVEEIKTPYLKQEEKEAPEDLVVSSTDTDIYFVDVGQGDCTLITEGDGHGIMIDTGAYWGYDNVVSVMDEAKVEILDMLILTHPDADHIQNADDLLSDYNVINVIMPDVKKDTGSFNDLMSAIQTSSVNVVYPEGLLTIPYGSSLIEIYSVKGEYEDINSYSLVTKLTKGEENFIFLGDATGEEIDELAANGMDFQADVMKAAHHGSANCGCNSEWLFNAVDPKYVVISCGYHNDYGHPHRETMEVLKQRQIDTYRTDLQGTILCRCDGANIYWNTEPTTVYTGGSDL